MEHARQPLRPPPRSTLATTTLAVCGLFAAAHLLHPGASEPRPRAARVVTVTAEASLAPAPWFDPPVRLRGAEPAALMADSARVLSTRQTVALPADARMAPPLSSALAAPVVAARVTDPLPDPLGDLIRGLDRDDRG